MSKGVLLVNLGSPKSTDPKDVKEYLDEFLMDERVIDVPYWARVLLVRGIVLNTRPKKSAAAYQKIWWDEGSPLIVLSERLQEKMDKNTSVPIALAMRYGEPSIKSGLQELHDKGVDEVLLFPLYPQFAMATTETILVLAEQLRKEHFPKMQFTAVPPFYNHADYIRVLAESIAEKLKGKDFQHLLFSYHGVPERHIRKSDVTKSHCKIDGSCCQTPSAAHQFCYRHQCYETTRLVAEYLELKENSYSVSFQSRLGFDPWLQPYTDRTIERFGKQGMKKLAIVTPAFVSDCLETLEEIAMEGEEIFHEVGGEEFTVVPCLNDRDDWVKVLSRWVDEWAHQKPVEA
ncbi:ferrochelatase [Salegentibacter mishustinae]|uniref:Ferrochelatase n=1 Tax=Salegentibacter mishustinae TaxID=270918 RepID=A0A0Q9Z4H4_9FLAO|nr:ferrochelatase [Salegentibacter mishustinae]KRG27775.1 ferrochelatase [Salegentibacter mishustinae]PNW20844.1 ferrochelatase [Salegentibacter mishustinae]PZX64151.1 ferrochelatase [Salegentibacter mishustinae]GGW90463.1 ferrochelatase [Salegentibacter mishustinae]